MGIFHFHVNSSLPRAGSELIQSCLAQHPDVYASATSPLLEYWFGAYGNYDLPERKSQDEIAMKRAFLKFCKSGAEGYYRSLTDRSVIIDKSRGWLEYANFLWEIFPEARIICMVRKTEHIIGSLEKIYQKNIGHPETRKLPKTAEERAKFWVSPGSFPLGLALQRLKERQSRPDSRVLYVAYEDLTSNPIPVMRNVFSHIGLTPIDIDPFNVKKSVPEDDKYFGIFGDHHVRPVIEPRQ